MPAKVPDAPAAVSHACEKILSVLLGQHSHSHCVTLASILHSAESFGLLYLVCLVPFDHHEAGGRRCKGP
jgi:hypothetical protein